MEIRYQEEDLDSILRYFVKGYEVVGERITHHEAIVDNNKGKVVFKLFVEKDEPGDHEKEKPRT